MKILDKMVLLELIAPFAFGVFAFTILFFAGDYLQDLSAMVAEGLPLSIAVKMVIYYLPTIVFYTLPMATLLAVIFTVSRLSGESEMVACFAGGISYKRILVPISVFVVLASIGSYLLNDYVSPASFMRLRNIEAAAKDDIKPQDKAVVVFDDKTQTLIRASGGFDLNKGLAKDISVLQFKDNKPYFLVYAKKALWQGFDNEELKFDWKLYDGYTQKLGDDFSARMSFGSSRTETIKIQKNMDELMLVQKAGLKNSISNMSFFELKRLLKYYKANPNTEERTVNKTAVMMWNRFALPLSCIILGLIAAPLALRTHRTNAGVGIGISLIVIFIYYVAWNYGSTLAYNGTLSPFIGSFGADILGLGAAFYFNRRVRM